MSQNKFLFVGLAVLVCAGALGLSRPAGAHSEPPPVPPADPKSVGVEVKPLRWSWLHWWEVNRSLFLVPAQQAGIDQDTGGLSREAMRDRAGQVLIKALTDPDPGVRSAAALSLGRLRVDEALPRLTALMENEPDEQVRHRAVSAIGLLGAPDAETFLLEHRYETPFLRAAGLLGMGWLVQPTPQLTARLDGLMGGDALTVNAASESLLGLLDGWTLERRKETLQSATSPWVVSRVIASLRDDGDAQTDALLLDLAQKGPMSERLASWRFLQQTHESKRRFEAFLERGGDLDDHKRYLDAWWAAHDAFRDLAPEPQRPEGMYGLPPALDLGEARGRERTVSGLELTYQARLRAVAVIVLGKRPIAGADRALRTVMLDDDEYHTVPRAYATVALGQLGDTASLPRLMTWVKGQPRRGRPSPEKVDLDDPLRGFAAIAMGLYARPHPTEQGLVDRPQHERAVERLVETLNDPEQNAEVRTACAIALGIAGRSASLRPMILVQRTLDPTDDAVLFGHLLLARAMLGDRNVVAPAKTLLASAPNRDEMSDILDRRAAVLALGLTGRDEAIPYLIEAWNETFYVNREVIYALSLSGAHGVGTAMIERLEKSGNHFERAYMARSLGELLSNQQPSRLAERLLVGREFTMKDGLLEDARLIANRFLYEYLIPSFEEPWY